MNRWQKQTLSNYQLLFDELNEIQTTVFVSFSEDIESARRKFKEQLFWFFVYGFDDCILELELDGNDWDTPNGYEYLDQTYADGESTLQKFDKYYEVKDSESLKKVFETEAHRMYNEGVKQAVNTVREADNGILADVYKTWHTMMDDKVRDTHFFLENETVPIEEDFVTYDGDYAPLPHFFQNDSNNINCRCIVTFSR